MTFAEMRSRVMEKLEPQYVSFSWENDHYSDGEVTTECRIYVECVRAHFRGCSWDEAYTEFNRSFGDDSHSPCPTDEVAG